MVLEIKEHIRLGKLEEALEIFSKFTNDPNHPLHNDSILLSRRYYKSENDYLKGVYSQPDFIIELNKISESALKSINSSKIDNDETKESEIAQKNTPKFENKISRNVKDKDRYHNYADEKKQFEIYISKIIELKRTSYKFAQPRFDTGVTQYVRKASYEIVEFYELALNKLSQFYPYNHFGSNSKEYFSEKISSRYNWHRNVLETDGVGQNGTIVHIMVGGAVMKDLDDMIKDMVFPLSLKYSADYKFWKKNWDEK